VPFVSPSVASLVEVAANKISLVKRIINNLLALGSVTPSLSITDIIQLSLMLDEIKYFYYSIYVLRLEKFLESKWFLIKGLA
jgi:hypothetical protein